MELNVDIQKEQEKAQEEIKNQGFRVLVCGGTGCVANGSEKVMEKFRELGANVTTLSAHDKMTVVPTGFRTNSTQFSYEQMPVLF